MLESGAAEVVTTIVIAVVLLIGVLSVILPILPGSPIVIIGLLVWAVLLGSPVVWITAGLGMVLTVAGLSASTVLTGRVLMRERIPIRPILVAVVMALVGLVLLPPLGLFLGFALGLFGAEYFRRDRNWREAGSASLQALRALGLGLLLEFFCAGTAVSLFVLGALLHLVF